LLLNSARRGDLLLKTQKFSTGKIMENVFDAQASGSSLLNEGRAKETGEIIERQQLENGMELILYDCSQMIAGDRWLVDIRCEACIPVDTSYWEIMAHEESRSHLAIREMLGEKLVFSSSKKRSFVDAGEKETILKEMVQQVYDSILKYLNRPDFPQRLFKKQYRDARQKVLLQQAMRKKAGD
jgi:hypothetical protein